VVQAVSEKLPGTRIERMDTDTVQTKGAYNKKFTALANGEVDILVGTQMIAKGLDFPGVSLVGVINADMSLFFEEFRMAERTFALLTQVAGRAGRGDRMGKVLIQTYCPRHYSIVAALHQNYEAFFEKEMKYRNLLSLPPYRRLVNLRIAARENEIAQKMAVKISNTIRAAIAEKGEKRTRVIGPAPCPLQRLRDRFRWQIVLAGITQQDNSEILEHPSVMKLIRTPGKGAKVIIDVDPQSLL